MFNMVLTNGEKIRKLREELGITLEELAGGEIKKSYLSMLENNKRNLTSDKAEIIARKINRIAHNKGKYFDFIVSTKTLMEDEETQAKDMLELRFEDVESNFDEKKVNDLIDIAIRYRISEYTIKLCELATEHFFGFDNTKAIEYAYKGEHTSTESNNMIKRIVFYNKLVKNYLKIKDYNEALVKNKKTTEYILENNIQDINILNNVNYNFAIIYKNKKDFGLALEYAYKVNVKNLSKSQLIDLKIVIANCSLDSNDLDYAIEQYKNLLKHNLNEETKARIYRNLSECYYKKNMLIKAIRYIEMCLEIRKKIKSNYLSDALIFSSDVYRAAKEIVVCKSCLFQSIKLDCNSEALEKLVDLYIDENNIADMTCLIENYAENFNTTTLLNLSEMYMDIDIVISKKIFKILKRKNNQGML